MVKTGRPVQMVASQAKTPTALGTAMMMEAALKKDSETSAGRWRTCDAPRRRSPAPWWRPSPAPPACSRPAGGGRTPAARPTPCPWPAARWHRPRDGRTSRTDAATAAPARRPDVEEMRAEIAVHPEQEEGQADGGNGEDIGGAGGQRAPDQDRHAVDRHARAAHAQEGDDEIDRANGGGDAQQDHAQRIEVDVGPGIVGARGVGNVIEPAVIGPEAEQEARIEKNAGAEIDPVGQRVQPRQRHVARAQQQAARDNC